MFTMLTVHHVNDRIVIMETLTKPATILSFAFPDTVVEAFTKGDCWVLAKDIEAATGYPIAMATYGDGYWCHAGNVLPNGLIVDIEGTRTEKEWVARWEKPTRHKIGPNEKLVMTVWTKHDLHKEIHSICMTPRYSHISNDTSPYIKRIMELI